YLQIDDTTTHETGSMSASAVNGFGQVVFAPKPSTQCDVLPYDFHPMYATSSEETRVPWTTHTFNVSFAAEIGHFQYCSRVNPRTHRCLGQEGDGERADRDDIAKSFRRPSPSMVGGATPTSSRQKRWSPRSATTPRRCPSCVN